MTEALQVVKVHPHQWTSILSNAARKEKWLIRCDRLTRKTTNNAAGAICEKSKGAERM